jgi:two-component system LytT family response regulator
MNKDITAIIVDDEPLALEGLRLRLEKISGIEIVAEAADGDEAIRLCNMLHPDVLFLDLRLPGISGLEVVQSLQSDVLPMVVFVTAFGEYAIEAFELNAIDYILKPANIGRLQKTVDRIKERHSPKQEDDHKYKLLKALGESSGIEIAELEEWLNTNNPLPSPYQKELVIKNSHNQKVFLKVTDIRWIDAAGDYMCIHTDSDTHIVRITMKKLANQLDDKLFQRVHKSTLVNINCIKGIETLRNNEGLLDLGQDVKIKVSRNYHDVIQKVVEARAL